MLAAESFTETAETAETRADDTDFMEYLAERLGIETREARARLSAWLNAYEAPPRSGVRKTAPMPEDAPNDIERSA